MLPPKIQKNSGKADKGRRSPAHRAFVRSHACCACGSTAGIECAHVRRANNSGMGVKPSDAFTVSLCAACHQESHRGEQTFETRHGVNLMALAKAFYFASPHRNKLDNVYGE